jgi:hypothetical protein
VLDHGLGVVGASAPGQQPAHQLLARDVEVDRGLHLDAEGLSRGEGRLGLLDGTRESVQDVAPGRGRGDDGFAQHIHHDAVRNQIAVAHVRLDRLPERRLVLDVLSQQVATADMGNAEPLGQSLSLGSLARARSADQQQAHLIIPASSWRDRPLVLPARQLRAGHCAAS